MTGLEALILAAGAGSRFGGGKLLASWRDGVVLDGAIRAALAAPADQVTLVWGADPRVPDAATACVQRLGAETRLSLVYAPVHTEGLGASLAAGIKSMRSDARGVFVFLGDMPAVPDDIAQKLAVALTDGADAVAPVMNGRRGHPVLFGRGLLPKLADLNGERGAAGLLTAIDDRLTLLPTSDHGVLFDIDTREDLLVDHGSG